MTDDDRTIQVHSIYIEAPAAKVWEALTTSEYTNKWGYGGDVTFDGTPGGEYINHTTPEMKEMGMGEVAMTATIIELDPPHKLVLDSQAVWHDEPPQRLTYELIEATPELTRVILTHDVTNAPLTASDVAGNNNVEQGGGGWPWTLASLKTLLETGRPMATAGA